MVPTPRRIPRISILFIFAAALLLQAGSLANSARAAGPEPFTAQLPEVNGVQAIISLRHPKLVNQDLEKLMAGVPEAAAGRAELSQTAEYGYPEFSDIAAGSNNGLAILSISGADLRAKSCVLIDFVKLKEGGKLWTLLKQKNLALQKHGDWTLIGKSDADIAKLKSPDGVIAYLEKPQTEDIRFWFRASPEFVAGVKETFLPELKSNIAGFPPEKQKAALAYFDTFFSLLLQLHSASTSLTFTDDSIKIAYSVQFMPGTPAGILTSYKAGPVPVVAQYVSADALATMFFRQNSKASADFANSVFEALIAVDYPPMSERLKKMNETYDAILAASDGGGAATFDLAVAQESGQERIKPQFFYVIAGHVGSGVAEDYFKESHSLSDYFTRLIRSNLKPAPGMGAIDNHSAYVENALTVDGVSFDSWTVSTTVDGRKLSRMTQYLGVVDGSLVMADSEATLRKQLPGLRARTVLADSIRCPDASDVFSRITVNGGKLVDLLASAAKLDLNNEDMRAEVNKLKAEYAAGGPATDVITVGQAKAISTLSIPYKFISASIHLGEYMSAQNFSVIRLLLPAAQLARPTAIGNFSAPSTNTASMFDDLSRRYTRGKLLAKDGKFAEALSEYLQVYDKGMGRDVNRSSIPLTPLLSSIASLGESYPPALQALRDRRALTLEWIKSHPAQRFPLVRFVAINQALNENASTLAYYDGLPSGSVSRPALTRLLFTQFIEAKRYADALQAKPYDMCSAQLDRFRQTIRTFQSMPSLQRLQKTQITLMATLGANEAEALAGVGDVVHARQIVADVLNADHSPATCFVLQMHLKRVGHGDWVAEEIKNQSSPEASPDVQGQVPKPGQ